MNKIYIADSYAGMEIISEPYLNEKGRLYVKIKGKCPRCGGSGNFSYNPLDGTRCYRCLGSGIDIQEVRAYSEKEYNQMQAAKERVKQRKEEAKQTKIKDRIENANKYKHEIALKLGFNEEEKVYMVCGGDTYSVKDELKAAGAKFNPVLKWYFTNPIELPKPYFIVTFTFDEIYDYSIKNRNAIFKNDVEKVISDKIEKVIFENNFSEYYPGEEKERIRNIKVKVSSIRGFQGIYGYNFIYTFTLDKYVFVWFTTKNIEDISIDDEIILTGTIKKFEQYMGICNTYLTRCIIKKEA